MKRVLVINTIDYVICGMSTVIMNYFENLDHQKYQMDFVINQNIVPKYLEIMKNGGAVTYELQRNDNPVNYFFKLWKIIRKNHYDVVHVHGNSCTMAVEMFAAKMAGCKHIIAHSHNSTCTHLKIHKLLRPLFEFSCHERLACSKLAGEWLFQKKSFTVIENALDLTKYGFSAEKRSLIREQLSIRDTDFVIGHVGFFNVQKNQRFIIELLNHMVKKGEKQVRLLLVGEGELRPEMEQLVNTYGLSEYVTFFGNTDDVVGVMSAMDVFLFPSIHEGLGIVMIEAQLTGLPCVASTAVPRDTEITDNCLFLSFDAPYSEWISNLIKKRKNDRTKPPQFKNIERFDLHKQVKRLEKIYGE